MKKKELKNKDIACEFELNAQASGIGMTRSNNLQGSRKSIDGANDDE